MPVFVTPSIPESPVAAGGPILLTVLVFNAGASPVSGTLTVPFRGSACTGRSMTSTGFGVGVTGNTASSPSGWVSDNLTIPAGASVVYEVDDTTRSTTDGMVPYSVSWAVTDEATVTYTAVATVHATIPSAPTPGVPTWSTGGLCAVASVEWVPEPAWVKVVPSVRIQCVGPTVPKGLTVRVYPNDVQSPLPDPDNWSTLWWDRTPVAELVVSGPGDAKQLPTSSVLLVDGTTERITLTCRGIDQPGDPWVYTAGNPRWPWPLLECGRFVVVVLLPAVVTVEQPPHETIVIPPVLIDVWFDEVLSA